MVWVVSHHMKGHLRSVHIHVCSLKYTFSVCFLITAEKVHKQTVRLRVGIKEKKLSSRLHREPLRPQAVWVSRHFYKQKKIFKFQMQDLSSHSCTAALKKWHEWKSSKVILHFNFEFKMTLPLSWVYIAVNVPGQKHIHLRVQGWEKPPQHEEKVWQFCDTISFWELTDV